MILLLAAALAAHHVAGRPPELVRPGEEAAYAAQLSDALARAGAQHAGAPCPSTATAALLGVQALGPAETLTITGPQTPLDAGTPVFRERFRMEGCPPDIRIENLMVARARNGGWWMMPFLPGDTIVTPRLAVDLRQPVFSAASRASTPCPPDRPRLQMEDTLVAVPPAKPGAAWVERWTLRYCGQPHSVLIAFKPTPADGGTDFVVKLER